MFGEITRKGAPVEKFNKLPNYIDGLKHYVIKDVVRNNLLTKCKDGRNWKRDLQTKWAGYKSVRYRNFKGSTFRPKKECLYHKEYQNEIIFTSLEMEFDFSAKFVVPKVLASSVPQENM